ncbi:hypothetical protein SARC_05073 [Sphaeroforma arctica JP610]|uniref:Uncharacterized protein n=1 Tax=Sphaeroforma arctica JP610 TaxID=667725 RepID=A0A0L0G0L9_9EUKA|nr:hypothetical protein SARC_05073 [Sphaeroforma arctica JP610]KNC82652.1 hypothetical protein SARC_05073 [Sphaeroforma arctica JP610]|eukprot:XP_014156554.1 hypothetical protein SARC_05073 [Sphaeroforma arctica JP610]
MTAEGGKAGPIQRALLPGYRPEVQAMRAALPCAVKGWVFNDVTDGTVDNDSLPRWSFKWWISYDGLQSLTLYFWLVKDFCWSQWYWYEAGIAAGSCAVFLSMVTLCINLWHRSIAEAWINFGLLCWIMGNYIWMIGEFKLENPEAFFNTDGMDEDQVYEMADAVYNQYAEYAKYILLGGSIWLSIYYVLRCFPSLPGFTRTDTFVREINKNRPPTRFGLYFIDFIEYEDTHVLLWVVKDCLWTYGSNAGYIIFVVPTFFLFADLIWKCLRRRGQLLHLFHNCLVMAWLFANTVWAIGEMVYYDDELPDEAYEEYHWPSDAGSYSQLYLRYSVGWLFCGSLIMVALFHLWWITVTLMGKLGPRRSAEEKFVDGPSDDGTTKSVIEVPSHLPNESSVDPMVIESEGKKEMPALETRQPTEAISVGSLEQKSESDNMPMTC